VGVLAALVQLLGTNNGVPPASAFPPKSFNVHQAGRIEPCTIKDGSSNNAANTHEYVKHNHFATFGSG
jgi:hypothetical protein